MTGPSRLGAVFMVTVLSCVVLGAVWGFVVSLLPDTTSLQEPPSRPLQTSLPPMPSSATLTPDAPAVPTAPPFVVKETPGPAQSSVPPRSASEVVPLPFGMDLKCVMEIDSLCPDGERNRQLCLQRQSAHLSVPCRPILRERLGRMKEHMHQLRVACEGDRRQYCGDESVRGDAIVQCLESHAQEVTERCFQLLPKRGRLLN